MMSYFDHIYRTIISVTFFTTVILVFGNATECTVIINEVMFNPDGDENAREYIELLNNSDTPVSIEGYIVGDGAGFDGLETVGSGGWILPPQGFALVLDPDYFDSEEAYGDIPARVPLFTVTDKAIGSRGLSNSTAEPVYLISADGDTLSVVTYDIDCPPGHSWERVLPSGSDMPENFKPSLTAGGSPGYANSVTPPSRYPVLDAGLVTFRPASPVMGGSLEIVISYRNAGLAPVSAVTVSADLLPDKPLGSVSFPETVDPGETSAGSSLYLNDVPGGRLGFRFILSTSDAVNADTLEVTLDVAVTAGSVILNEIMAAPATGQPEWIELLNTGDLPVDLFGYGILDSKATSPAVVQRHTFLSGGGYAILAADELPFSLPDEMPVIRTDGFPALNNDGDKVILLDYAGTVADSVSYAATEKGYSLERIDTGTGWDTCTDPSGATPGRLNSISFDAGGHVKSVTIDIDPNPFGYVTTVSYELPFPLARVSLTIYDRRGRQVATLRDGEESGSDWSCTWDGSSGGSRLPAGPYILNLEAIDKRTGRIVTERKVIVIGTKL